MYLTVILTGKLSIHMPSYLFCGEASPHSSSVGCNGIVVCDDLQTSLGNQFRVSDGGGAVGIRGVRLAIGEVDMS